MLARFLYFMTIHQLLVDNDNSNLLATLAMLRLQCITEIET